MNFYELDNIEFLTDTEFEEIFDNFKIAVQANQTYWVRYWSKKTSIDSIVTLKGNDHTFVYGSDIEYLYVREFHSSTYRKDTKHDDIFVSSSVHSCISEQSYAPCRANSIISLLTTFCGGGGKISTLKDNAPSEPRQLTKEQLKTVLSYVDTLDRFLNI